MPQPQISRRPSSDVPPVPEKPSSREEQSDPGLVILLLLRLNDVHAQRRLPGVSDGDGLSILLVAGECGTGP